MPRKSLRTATTTYRRRQLTWDDSESCIVNLNDENGESVSGLIPSVKKVRGRLVTPSPRSISTSDRVERNESSRRGPPRRKRLFRKKKASRKKPMTTAVTSGRKALASEKSTRKRLFHPPQTDGSGSSVSARGSGAKRSRSRKRPLKVAAKVVSSKTKSRRYQKRAFASGDSLATFVSFKKTLKNSDKNTIVSTNTRTNFQKESRRHAIGTIEKNEKSEGSCDPQISSPPTTITTQDDDFERTEKNTIASFERDNEPTLEKNNKSIPPELISLLTSRPKKRGRRTRARSTLEILDEFNKKKKELESKQGTRASLPRACKRSAESVVNEDTDGDTGSEPENDIDDDDDDGDWTEDSTPSQMKESPIDEDSTKVSVATSGSSTKKSSADPPIATTLKPRPRRGLSSSAFSETQSSLRLVPPALEDDCESDAGGASLRKQQSQCSDSLREAEAEILLPKVNRRENTDGRISNPAPRIPEDASEDFQKKTSQLDSQEQGSVHSRHKRRRRLMHDTNDFDVSDSGAPPSNKITSDKLSPQQDSQQLWERPSRPSYYRRAKQSMERGSPRSRDSKNERSMRQFGSKAANSFPRVLTQESYEGTSGAPRKISSNLSVLRRGSQRMRLEAGSNSRTELVSLSNGESRTHESPSRAKQHLRSSPRRKKEQQPQKQWKSDNLSTSGKKVRFDSSTTTFSVKIKIKTNLDTASSQDRNGSDYSQAVPYSPSLDESAVQAIANQVTQACLTQARTSAGRSNSSIVRNCGDSVVNVDVDVNDEDGSCSSNSNQSSDAGKPESKLAHGSFGERNESIVDERPEESYLSRRDFDDWRSVTSELTSDWNRPKSSIDNDQNHCDMGRQRQGRLFSKEQSIHNDFAWKDRYNAGQCTKSVNQIEKTHLVENDHRREGVSASNAMRPPRAISKSHRYGETRSQSSVSRRQRIRSCGDSLAGSAFGSIASAVEGDVSRKIPREVSLRQPSTGSTGWRSPRNKLDTTKYTQSARRVDKVSNKETETARSEERNVESARVLPIPSHKSSRTYRCGKCKGCRRTFDCQTCKTCIEKLHSFGSLQAPSVKEGLSLCLERRCQRACRIGFVDSLLGTKSSVNELQTTDRAEQTHTLSTNKPLSHGNAAEYPMVTNNNVVQDSHETASRTMSAPWAEGDDWTVDYSYLSEPEYRRHWGKNFKPSSSTRSLTTPSGRLPVHKKQSMGAFGGGGGGRTSLSSVSESIVSQKRARRTMPSLTMPRNNPQAQQGRKRKGGKRKRDPLHGIALPRTSTDACSVTSWRENRKCLRALMEYDEADQDWV